MRYGLDLKKDFQSRERSETYWEGGFYSVIKVKGVYGTRKGGYLKKRTQTRKEKKESEIWWKI